MSLPRNPTSPSTHPEACRTQLTARVRGYRRRSIEPSAKTEGAKIITEGALQRSRRRNTHQPRCYVIVSEIDSEIHLQEVRIYLYINIEETMHVGMMGISIE